MIRPCQHLASLVGYCIVVVGASLVKVPELGVAHELGTCRIHFVISEVTWFGTVKTE